jgi:hypothetical protein
VAVHWFEEATVAPQVSLAVHMHKDLDMDKLVEDRKTIPRPLSTTIQIGLHVAYAANFLHAIIHDHVDQSAENRHAKDLWDRATPYRAIPQRWRTSMPQPRSQRQAH